MRYIIRVVGYGFLYQNPDESACIVHGEYACSLFPSREHARRVLDRFVSEGENFRLVFVIEEVGENFPEE